MEIKKRILVIITSYRHGGICRSLQNWLSIQQYKDVKIDVFAIDDFGPYKDKFNNCQIVRSSYILSTIYGRFSSMPISQKILAICIKSLRRIIPSLQSIYSKHYIRKIAQGYDTVIGFGEGLPTLFASWSQAKNRISWIHCDYKSYKTKNGNIDESDIYENIDKTICVSNFTADNFSLELPKYKGKVHVIYNILDIRMMRQLASSKYADNHFLTNKFTIITIGRLDPVKNISVIPEIAKIIHERGLEFRWYIIGPASVKSEYDKLISGIKAFNVKECVIYLGETDNPYYYLSKSDLLINTSTSEACPYVINEAKILGVPVICNNFGSASEFVANGENGYIKPIHEFATTIIKCIINSDSLMLFRKNLLSFNYDNDDLLKKIHSIL